MYRYARCERGTGAIPCRRASTQGIRPFTVSVRLCAPGAGEPQVETRTFEALPSGLDEMVAWMRERSGDGSAASVVVSEFAQ